MFIGGDSSRSDEEMMEETWSQADDQDKVEDLVERQRSLQINAEASPVERLGKP